MTYAFAENYLILFTRLVHKVSFPGAGYNFTEIFISTDTASVQLFFSIFATGIETFVIPWGQVLNSWDSESMVVGCYRECFSRRGIAAQPAMCGSVRYRDGRKHPPCHLSRRFFRATLARRNDP
ncbi:hypothetical protein L798_14492 [Zootermopsis nevadensis]|uniref:Uncharacterized protein n=1 Tax=Zootermopsis nevadensis TaxID=136037 RepID=A0A067RUT3_ZOONE|nr:hypothetical protein L798_14492 [Zootermopsis nevadensis]